MDKRTRSERNICTKFIKPALERARWEAFGQFHSNSGLKARAFAGSILGAN